jgi:hypothetical protein
MRARAAAWVLLLVAACRSAAATPATDAPTSCPATRPDSAAAPPAWIARDAGAGPGTGWLLHGDSAQWVRLPTDGALTTYHDPRLPPEQRQIGMKFPWYRVAEGRLTVEGRRLDAPAPPLQARVPDGYGPTGFQPTGLVFPTPGCWEVTGKLGEDELRFVLWVRPPIPGDVPAPTTTTVATAAPAQTPTPAASPPTTSNWGTIGTGDAREVATVLAYLDAYNAGRLDETMALLADRPAYYACDYAGQGFTAVATTAMAGGREAVADWLRARFADHDHITLESLGVGPNTRAVAVRIRRRTSDSLRRLGFAAGTAPQATGKWVVTPSAGTPEEHAVLTQVMLAGKVGDCTRL